jgi:hypothetical protein
VFNLGFVKVAYDGTNNQGLEFKNSDTNNSTANVGPGGMTPQGFETYEPTGESPKKGKAGSKKKDDPKPMDEKETALFLVSKYAKVNERLNMTSSRAADGVSAGLKKDQETTDATYGDLFASNKASKEEHKKYIRAGLK